MGMVAAASLADLEVDRRTLVTVRGKRVALYRRADGSVEAMETVCRHQNAELAEVDPVGGVITCPRHGWRYDATSGECLTESWAGWRRFRVELDGDEVRVDPTPIEEEAGPSDEIPDLSDWT